MNMLHDRFSELEFQLTASQGGWHTSDVSGIPAHRISTHSLTRRLTSLRVDFLSHVMHFNSQPHKEADTKPEYSESPEMYFNSQPHKEADTWFPHCWFVFLISTHSLTRRLTTLRHSTTPTRTNFNSQPHKEADLDNLSSGVYYLTFQLTASQGGWPCLESVEWY